MAEVYRVTTERSKLQREIITHICITRSGADYHSISKATDRDRITIKQSLYTLMERRYVTAEKDTGHGHGKTARMRFFPTHKGIAFTVAIIGVDPSKIKHVHPDKGPFLSRSEYALCIWHDFFHADGQFPDAVDLKPISSLLKRFL